uniref:Putative tank binding protein kinase tbk1 n=1 Tax=Triatoma infestans TaxID=30076 RepID=A0A023F4E0_TRIIF
MSFLRGSTNYVWCTTSVLGKGATGAVFQGVNKNNGEPVAVKTFNQLSHMRPHDVQIREFEVLKKVKHENIVKLLAIEEEQESRGKVIVMELCTGGSLFNILDDPENTYGLQEEEFLLVVEHLTAGMKHLRDNNLVHRDLKPGNIMKFITDDGSTVYKLTDFGAARELDEDEQFVSLYGTEEYLHPDMYARAVLRKAVRKTFGATVDLWSIGVTLFHVATGNLPFRPYGGRRNKETMYFITTKKESGVISGTQSLENGPINWSRTLPKSCQLSTGLKKYITPLLAGLLEVDTSKIWTFEKFFTEVTNMLSRKRIHIYHVHRMHNLRVYLHQEEKIPDLEEQICEQTDVLPENQILLFNNGHLRSSVPSDIVGKNFPTTSDELPIVLFSNENNNIIFPNDGESFKLPSFPDVVNVENDASIAKTVCSICHDAKRRIERLSLCSKLTHDSVRLFNSVVKQELLEVLEKTTKVTEATKQTESLVDAIVRAQNTINSLLSLTPSPINWQLEIATLSEEIVNGVSGAISPLHQRYVTQDTLLKEWSRTELRCVYAARTPHRAASLVRRLRDSWQHMVRDRATRTLTYNDEQFHVLERMKMDVMGKELVRTILDREVCSCLTLTADYLADWYKMAQTIFLQAKILGRDADTCSERLARFRTRLHEQDILYHANITTKSLGPSKIPHSSSNYTTFREEDIRPLRTSLTQIQDTHRDISSLVRENKALIDQFCSVARDIATPQPTLTLE